MAARLRCHGGIANQLAGQGDQGTSRTHFSRFQMRPCDAWEMKSRSVDWPRETRPGSLSGLASTPALTSIGAAEAR